jgi:hypothetical protein
MSDQERLGEATLPLWRVMTNAKAEPWQDESTPFLSLGVTFPQLMINHLINRSILSATFPSSFRHLLALRCTIGLARATTLEIWSHLADCGALSQNFALYACTGATRYRPFRPMRAHNPGQVWLPLQRTLKARACLLFIPRHGVLCWVGAILSLFSQLRRELRFIGILAPGIWKRPQSIDDATESFTQVIFYRGLEVIGSRPEQAAFPRQPSDQT